MSFNKTEKEQNKNLQHKEKLLKNYVFPLCAYVFPVIQRIEFYKVDKYKDIITKSMLELILCEYVEVREKVKDILEIIYNL